MELTEFTERKNRKKTAKLRLLQPALPFLALPLLAASALGQTTGVSNPDQLNDTDAGTPPRQTLHYVKPSSADPVSGAPIVQAPAQAAGASAEAQSYPATGPAPEVSFPATGPVTVTVTQAASQPAQPAPALIVRQPDPNTGYAPAQTAYVQPAPLASAGDDSGIVTAAPTVPFQLGSGTVLKARLDQAFSTETTTVGTAFSAQLLADAGHSGEVLLPAGSVIHGHVTAVHGGRRIGGPASIRLQPQTVTLPDGTTYPLLATVSGVEGDLDGHVTDEGAIQPNGHPKQTAEALGLTTGAAAVTGAVIGGGVGAVVGAGIGVGVGTVVWLRQDQQEHLPSGTTLYLRLDEPLQLNPR